MRCVINIVLFLLLPAGNATAHEFWISPLEYQLAPGQDIVAGLRVGEGFEGAEQGYIPAHFERFELVRGRETLPVSSRIGDRPAMSQAGPDDGLWVIVHETRDARLFYRDAALFREFVSHKGLVEVLRLHAERELPDAGFYERYRRYAKSLVAVGSGLGADQAVGLRAEIVALENPYTTDLKGEFPVHVFFESEAAANWQVELFARDPSGAVQTTTHRTDARGRALLPVEPGHEYLVDAVFMTPLDVQNIEIDPAWHSHWASLTFSVPH